MKIEYNTKYALYMSRLKKLYEEMDALYEKRAKVYGFNCRGCIDSCCKTSFHHHTLLEYLYIIKGFEEKDSSAQNSIKKRVLSGGEEICPLNFKGLCVLYENRPMICRLHGIPHIFIRPDGMKIKGAGCDEFYKTCKQNFEKNKNIEFDRTDIYKKMAFLEKKIREASKINLKIKLTVSEILSDYLI